MELVPAPVESRAPRKSNASASARASRSPAPSSNMSPTIDASPIRSVGSFAVPTFTITLICTTGT
ncbi:MAG: hypothetical protein AMS20_16565 [Gemmatimonas sp. SG8_28]|nr:MAG: hypothetical protein AMS20_16565 [Gemmatimonas sp. SG8_28]